MKFPFVFTICAVASFAYAAPLDSGGGPVKKKLIGLGWDSPDAETYFTHLKEIEASPFDGIRIQLSQREENGVRINLRNLFSANPWKKEWFQRDIDLLRKAKGRQLPESFLSFAAGPAVDWFDDQAWVQVIDHARIVAGIAKDAGLRGLIFDAEVGSAQPAFAYLRQREREQYTFDEYAAKARERGREMMKAMAEEYPEMTVFTLFMASSHVLGALGDDPRSRLENQRNYSLYPAFLNGWLDAMPPGMTLVDGAEYSYPHTDEAQYLKHVNAVRNGARALVAPENQVKYRAQVEAGLAIYLDAYTNHAIDNVHSDVYNDPPLRPGERLVDRLKSAVMSAQHASDQYVWIWGEHYRWWPTSFKRVAPQKWEAILPGITEALTDGMDREKAALARATREFEVTEHKTALRGWTLKNLVENGGFYDLDSRNAALTKWKSEGSVTADIKMGHQSRGAARIEGGASSHIVQEIALAPALRYVRFRVHVRQMGEGVPVIKLNWLAEEGAPLGESRSIAVAGDPRDSWKPAEETLAIPEGGQKLRVELTADRQASGDDVIWFDDVQVIPIAVN